MAEEYRNDPITYSKMDYSEHEKTYARFLGLVKYGSIFVVAVLLGMLAYLIAGWGILGGLFAFVASGLILSFFLGSSASAPLVG